MLSQMMCHKRSLVTFPSKRNAVTTVSGHTIPGYIAFPRKSRAVVGDIRKNGQNFGDLNFHKI